jgi:hypothetical protein
VKKVDMLTEQLQQLQNAQHQATHQMSLNYPQPQVIQQQICQPWAPFPQIYTNHP